MMNVIQFIDHVDSKVFLVFHQDWASVEAGIIMSCSSYIMERFQRNPKARLGGKPFWLDM
jgi:hypothetical protein